MEKGADSHALSKWTNRAVMPQKAIPDLALQTWGPCPRTAEMRWVTRGEDSLDQEKRVVVFLTLGHSDS